MQIKEYETDTGLVTFLKNGNIFLNARTLGTYDTTEIG